jgi:hypothetical protein
MSISIPIELWNILIEKIEPNTVTCGHCERPLNKICITCKKMYNSGLVGDDNLMFSCLGCKKDVCPDCFLRRTIKLTGGKCCYFLGCKDCYDIVSKRVKSK